MTVALLVRNSPAARLLAHRVAESHELLAVVVESGHDARRGKLRRELRRGLPWLLPLTILDLAALAVYQWSWSRYRVRRDVAVAVPQAWPASTITHVDDVNDEAGVALLTRLKPEICLVFGTGILRGRTLRLGSRYVLNIHGGIVPAYRNVHSEFWCVLRNDLGNLGTSIIHLDEGIDSGAVALQRRLMVDPDESLFSIRYRNARLAIETALEALAIAARGPLPTEPQDPAKRGFFRTPRLVDLMRMSARRFSK